MFNLGLRFGLILQFCWTMQVTSRLLKLVLRNNALSSLRGIENLKSLEALDVSYNVISNFSELEFLGGLPSLQSLWLEGNPLCCASWYRSQVFSYFSNPEKVSYNLFNISLDSLCLVVTRLRFEAFISFSSSYLFSLCFMAE